MTPSPPPSRRHASGWKSEELFFAGDAFFDRILAEIAEARHSIDIAVYIFENGSLADRFRDALSVAAARGVRVRLMVDGVGSPGFSERYGEALARSGVAVRIFHPLPWDRWAGRALHRPWLIRTLYLLSRLNRRNHQKLFIIDRRAGFVGSLNVSDHHLESIQGREAWRDTGARVEGPPTLWLIAAFQTVWDAFEGRDRWKHLVRMGARGAGRSGRELVELNQDWRRRRLKARAVIDRVRKARKRIWLTSPYFVPHGRFIRALQKAAKRGVDVRILLSARSDVVFMPWVAWVTSQQLIRSGVRIYEYLPSILHAKDALIDDWARVGSSNLNHRSWIHDLELNVILTQPGSIERLETRYRMDLALSEELSLEHFKKGRIWERLLGRILYLFRYFL